MATIAEMPPKPALSGSEWVGMTVAHMSHWRMPAGAWFARHDRRWLIGGADGLPQSPISNP